MIFIITLCLFTSVHGDTPTAVPGVLKQNWGYISVRPGAQMFYWVYFTQNYTHRPLVMWLQGGPGASSTGIGNFLEVGPLDISQKMRRYPWTNQTSILFVDSPVGTGFSYVWDKSLIPHNDTSAASDLLTFLKIFYKKVSDLVTSPFYIFGESYGGKIAAEFALQLSQAIKKKKIRCSLRGVALGDAWISPTDSVNDYAKFLYANSLIDVGGFTPVVAVADKILKEVSQGQMVNASATFFAEMEPLVEKETNGVNFYNILALPDQAFGHQPSNCIMRTPATPLLLCSGVSQDCGLLGVLPKRILEDLSKLMNGCVKAHLQLPRNVTWGAQSASVYDAMRKDFMRPALNTVESLLNTTTVEVMVYNGQLDLIVPSIGTETWLRKIKWPGRQKWLNAERKPMKSKNNGTLGFYKTYKNLSFFWILRAGHLVPMDAPAAAYMMFCNFLAVKC